jgi:hypothetical protein
MQKRKLHQQGQIYDQNSTTKGKENQEKLSLSSEIVGKF